MSKSLDIFAPVIIDIGTERFSHSLMLALNQLAAFDGLCIIQFYPDRGPQVLCDDLPRADYKVFWQTYMKGAYLLDPFYRICAEGRSGMFHLREIMPEGFTTSSYYKNYFAPAENIDEINYLLQADGFSVLIGLSRSVKFRRFSAAEGKKMDHATSMVETLVLKHIELIGANHSEATAYDQPAALKERLDSFGKLELTVREHEIAHLMLLGYSSKAAANQLEISPATERVHRKSIYRKMNVNSHAELLAQAFNFLIDPEESIPS